MFEEMFNRKFWVATIIAIGVIIAWDIFFLQDIREQDKLAKEETKKQETILQQAQGSGSSKILGYIVDREQAKGVSKRIEIENDKIFGSLSLIAGRIDDISLKDYKETLEDDSPNIRIFDFKNTENAYFFESGWLGSNLILPDNKTIWQTSSSKLTPESPVILTWKNPQGITFRKTISIDNQYLITIEDTVIANSDIEISAYALILRHNDPNVQDFFISHEGFVGYLNNTLERVDYDDTLKKSYNYDTKGGYLGYTDKYWLSALLLDPNLNKSARFLSYKDSQNINNYQLDYKTQEIKLQNKQSYSNISRVFVGPKEYKIIKEYSKEYNIKNFDDTLDFGWFFFFTKPMIQFLLFLYGYFGHFGIAILVFTVIIRLIILPIAYKSYVSMAKMRELQPKMKQLKELHKDDMQRYNKELMNLYRKEKVNPLSGCLPILLQIPIFFSIYKVIFISLELRQSAFFGWVKDMSVRDSTNIFELFGLIPWGAPDFLHIGIWPILMGATMYVQQKLSTSTATMEPIQQKIISLMPWMLVIILGSFPAGLVIYWTWSNIISIFQQLYINKKVNKSYGIKIGNFKC